MDKEGLWGGRWWTWDSKLLLQGESEVAKAGDREGRRGHRKKKLHRVFI